MKVFGKTYRGQTFHEETLSGGRKKLRGGDLRYTRQINIY